MSDRSMSRGRTPQAIRDDIFDHVGEDYPVLALIVELEAAIRAEAAHLYGLREAAQAVVDSALLTEFGPDEEFWTVHSAALDTLRAALRDEGETPT